MFGNIYFSFPISPSLSPQLCDVCSLFGALTFSQFSSTPVQEEKVSQGNNFNPVDHKRVNI